MKVSTAIKRLHQGAFRHTEVIIIEGEDGPIEKEISSPKKHPEYRPLREWAKDIAARSARPSYGKSMAQAWLKNKGVRV